MNKKIKGLLVAWLVASVFATTLLQLLYQKMGMQNVPSPFAAIVKYMLFIVGPLVSAGVVNLIYRLGVTAEATSQVQQ